MTRRILVVCTGNVCRSPMAAALLTDKIAREGHADSISVSSAGTWATEGALASPNADLAMKRYGLSLESHRGRLVSRPLLDQSDLTLAMTQNHRDSLRAEFPEFSSRIRLFSDLGGHSFDIGDPIGGSLVAYQACAAELASLIENGYPRLLSWLRDSRRVGPESGPS